MGNLENRRRWTDSIKVEKVRSRTMDAAVRPLPLNSAFFASVWAGDKNSTIRKGKRKVREGDLLMLTDGIDNQVSVNVTDVKIKRLDELTEADAKRDGFHSLGELFQTLKDIYPTVEPQDPVTIIGFEVVQG